MKSSSVKRERERRGTPKIVLATNTHSGGLGYAVLTQKHPSERQDSASSSSTVQYILLVSLFFVSWVSISYLTSAEMTGQKLAPELIIDNARGELVMRLSLRSIPTMQIVKLQ